MKLKFIFYTYSSVDYDLNEREEKEAFEETKEVIVLDSSSKDRFNKESTFADFMRQLW